MRALYQAHEAIAEEIEFVDATKVECTSFMERLWIKIKTLQNSICKRRSEQRKTETPQDETEIKKK